MKLESCCKPYSH